MSNDNITRVQINKTTRALNIEDALVVFNFRQKEGTNKQQDGVLLQSSLDKGRYTSATGGQEAG
jgi:hypothetical protein